MKKLRKTEAKLKKSVAYNKSVYISWKTFYSHLILQLVFY